MNIACIEHDIDFCLEVYIPHWSGCWGGNFEKQPVVDVENFLEEHRRNTPWLETFLRNSDLVNIKVETIERSRNGKNKIPVGEYITKAILSREQDLFFDLATLFDSNSLWVVTMVADGELMVPNRLEKQEEAVGSGNLIGCRINVLRYNPGVVFGYKVDMSKSFGIKHASFCPTGGVIAANLYRIGELSKAKDWSKVDISSLAPLRSAVIHYRKPQATN